MTQLSPLVVGGLIAGLHISERQAGNLVFAEFLVLSIAAIAIAPFLPRLPLRAVCTWSVILTVIANGGTLLASDLATLTLLRCLAGASAGLVYAAALAVVASHSQNPDRVYGLFQLTWAALSIVLFSLGGNLTAQFAHHGIFGLISVVCLLLAPLMLWLPAAGTRRADAAPADTARGSMLMGVTTFAGIFVYLVASATIYTFAEPIGRRAGLGAEDIGYLLTAGALLGLAGAGAATWINVRYGRLLPITVFSVELALVALAQCLVPHPVVFGVSLILSIIFFYFSVPYLFGIAAALDRQGRWAAAAGSAYLLGFAAGPAVAGALIDWSGYPMLGISAAVMCVVAWATLSFVARHVERTGACVR